MTAEAPDSIGADYTPFSFTITRANLAQMCDQAARVVPSTDFQPVLRNFQVAVSPGQVRLAGTDLDLTVIASCTAVTTTATESVVLPAKRLQDIIHTAPEGDITFGVAADRAEISAGSARWSLRLPDGSDYPALPDIATLDLQEVLRGDLLAALAAVRHAAGREGGRPNLQQVVIAKATDGTTKLTACDGGRFAQVSLEFPFTASIPRGALDELIRQLSGASCEKVEVGQGEDGILVFRLGTTVFTTAPAPAKFPDVEKLLLKPALTNTSELAVSRSALAAAIKRVRITADVTTSAIALRLAPGSLEVVSRDAVGNRAAESLDAEYTGPERTLVVSHIHLSDLLAVSSQESVLFLLGPDSAKKKSPLLARFGSGLTGVISQMVGAMVGYEDSQ